MERPYALSERSDSGNNINYDDFDNSTLYGQFSGQNWDSNLLLDDQFALPAGVVHLHDKHSLSLVDREESESKRQELIQDSGKKKPGRKPILDEPTTKRKAQNRAAQRAFRERKETHVKELEIKVAELEQQNDTTSKENQHLRAELARLRGDSADNSFAQSSDFTFDFPSNQSHRSNSQGSLSRQSPGHGIPRASDCPSLCSSNTSPLTTIEKDFNAASMPFFARNESYPESQFSSSDSGTSAAVNKLSPYNLGISDSPLALLDNESLHAPSLATDPFFSQIETYNFDLKYRDTNIFDTLDIDPPLFESNGLVEAFSDNKELSLDLFNPTEYKSAVLVSSDTDFAAQEEVLSNEVKQDTSETENKQTPCPQVWQRIVAHPKFASFDLDLLCDEFSKKNRCSASQDVFKAPDDTDSWNRFDRQLDEFASRQQEAAVESHV